MELHNIEILLNEYLEGKTSLEEEKELRTYFASEDVAPQFKEYQVLFGFFEKERERNYEPAHKTDHKNRAYPWLAIAAGIAVIIGVFLFNPTPQKRSGVIEDPEVALQKTKDVLDLIAQQMHNGKKELVYLTAIENTRDELIVQNLKLKK